MRVGHGAYEVLSLTEKSVMIVYKYFFLWPVSSPTDYGFGMKNYILGFALKL